ncbi:MAG TPA: hypothetical protein VF440_07895 [Novosphingobium sp.]
MKRTVLGLTIAATLLAGTAVQAREKLTGEEKLAKLLEGRVAGAPVNCINLATARGSQIIDRTAIVYDSGNTIYVNRPRHPQALDSDDILVTRTWGSQLCKLDIVRLRDRTVFVDRGFVGLEQFVPYRRVAKND